MSKTKIRIVRTKSKNLEKGDFVVLYNKYTKIVSLAEVFRGQTLIHKHKYVEIDFGNEYHNDVQRFYDFDNESFDKLELKW